MTETKRKWFGGALSVAGAIGGISSIILIVNNHRASHLVLALTFAAIGGSVLTMTYRAGWWKTLLVIAFGFNVVLQGLLFFWQP